jgi:hypothetical protein
MDGQNGTLWLLNMLFFVMGLLLNLGNVAEIRSSLVVLLNDAAHIEDG